MPQQVLGNTRYFNMTMSYSKQCRPSSNMTRQKHLKTHTYRKKFCGMRYDHFLSWVKSFFISSYFQLSIYSFSWFLLLMRLPKDLLLDWITECNCSHIDVYCWIFTWPWLWLWLCFCNCKKWNMFKWLKCLIRNISQWKYITSCIRETLHRSYFNNEYVSA